MTMVLKRNLEYWQISLKNPEAAVKIKKQNRRTKL